MRAAEKLPEINPHKKMAASGMEHALRTFYVHAAAPANGGNGRAACCKPPVLRSYYGIRLIASAQAPCTFLTRFFEGTPLAARSEA
jgi:hypothetical protein